MAIFLPLIRSGFMRRVIAATVLLALACVSRGQDTVALRAGVRAEPGGELRLGDIAAITGPQAASLSALPISADAAGLIDLAAVRRAVEAAAGINAGRIAFSGGVCRVRPALVPLVREESEVIATEATPFAGTVRQHVTARLAETLGVASDALRLTFEQSRAELLNTPTQGRVVTAQQTGTGDKVTLAVRVYEGDTLIAQGTLAVGVLVRREVTVSKEAVSRGEPIPAEALTGDMQWIPLTVKPAALRAIAASKARARIDAGSIIEERHIEAPLAVRRGDLLSLDCLSGGLVVRTTGKALDDAKEGETIPVETLQWRSVVTAKVSRSGHAVIVGGAGVSGDTARSRGRRTARVP
ncbi:MAG: flagellar basal body P-ring formation protein FlgA [Phycisphaerae bacterium]|nr:flagellar basal body P-ring formation protein FlgA [Phycisphaerae bacterium]